MSDFSGSVSSGDDIPISSLGGKKSRQRSINKDDNYEDDEFGIENDKSDEEEFDSGTDEAEFNDDEDFNGGNSESDRMDDDDFIVDDDEDDDEGEYSDESDDVPLSSLKSQKKKTNSASSSKEHKKKEKSSRHALKKKTVSKKKKVKTKKVGKNPRSKERSSTVGASDIVFPSTELYAKCEKGKLIQAVLARWWYSYEWPDASSLPKKTPKGYDALDGFPGVYICTSGDRVGSFKDYRDLSKAPSFLNFAKKRSEDLKELLLLAIQGQRNALLKADGEGTDTERDLRVLEKWATKLNCAKADKEADKVLKAARLCLM